MKQKKYIYVCLIILTFLGCAKQQNIQSNQNNQSIENTHQEIVQSSYTAKNIMIKPSKDDKTFIREYTYNVSDDDSKNSARSKAIQQIKILLSEEIGTHIESSLNMTTASNNSSSLTTIKEEINSLSVAITHLNILQENWNGKEFYIKASVRVNPKQALELLQTTIKNSSNQEDIATLNKLLVEKDKKLHNINKQITLQEYLESNVDLTLKDYNLGFLANQKYGCVLQGKIEKNQFVEVVEEDKNVFRFFVDMNNILHTQTNQSLKNIAPQMYKNHNMLISLLPYKNKRYIEINSNHSTEIYFCTKTKFWSVVE